jgi:DNA-directed RNA polymerase subunit RPC12/RpoP/ABC-type transporter Mla MlaB component
MSAGPQKVLTIQFGYRESEAMAALIGAVTQDARFDALRDRVIREPGPLVVDLGAVARISSGGLRRWFEFVEACEAAGVTLVLDRCAPCVVVQMGLVHGFAGTRGSIRSVLAPYRCQRCGHEHLELVELDRGPVTEIADGLACPKCKDPMQLEEMPQVYSQFLSRLSSPPDLLGAPLSCGYKPKPKKS